MEFINSYKRLEKLCNEIYDDNHGISDYIDDMADTLDGAYYVSNWDDDLKQLKHYRWVRNKIVHEPDCTEENMCESDDSDWLDDFHNRIMNQTDPLSFYRQAIEERTNKRPSKPQDIDFDESEQNAESEKKSNAWIFSVIIIVAAILYFVIKYFLN
ncbi:MAG: DUF6548 family protein [Eubacterium sp.]|nr:DUF6548 family protein [Eubacterium sp.]